MPGVIPNNSINQLRVIKPKGIQKYNVALRLNN